MRSGLVGGSASISEQSRSRIAKRWSFSPGAPIMVWSSSAAPPSSVNGFAVRQSRRRTSAQRSRQGAQNLARSGIAQSANQLKENRHEDPSESTTHRGGPRGDQRSDLPRERPGTGAPGDGRDDEASTFPRKYPAPERPLRGQRRRRQLGTRTAGLARGSYFSTPP